MGLAFPKGSFVGRAAPVDVPNIELIPLDWTRARGPGRYLTWATTRAPWSGAATIGRCRSALRQLVSEFAPDVVYWGHSFLAAAAFDCVPEATPQVIEFANVEILRHGSIQRSSTRRIDRFLTSREDGKALKWEPRVARRADLTVALTNIELEWLDNNSRSSVLAPNGIAQVNYEKSTGLSNIMTAGSWTYPPNADGLRDFLLKHWPRIKAANPNATLTIAGHGGREALQGFPLGEGVEILGFVESLFPFFDACDLFLAPARGGGGSQLKIADAAAHGRVTIGPDYLRREVTSDNAAFVVATDDMAQDVTRLLQDDQSRWSAESLAHAYATGHGWRSQMSSAIREIESLSASSAA